MWQLNQLPKKLDHLIKGLIKVQMNVLNSVWLHIYILQIIIRQELQNLIKIL